MNFKVCLTSAFFLVSVNMIAQRETKLINSDWYFRFSHQVERGTEKRVDLPHTWNTQDVLNGNLDYKRGIGNYTKKLIIEKAWKDKRIFVRFKGANSVTNLFLNGKYLGEHKGGYTAFVFELTDNINWSKDNYILARVNNAERLDVMPLVGDFNFYGGIYRDVELIITEPVSISLLDYASSGVYIEQKSINEKNACVNIRTVLSNSLNTPQNAKLKIKVMEGNKVKCVSEKYLMINKLENLQNENIELNIDKPHLWNSKQDPFIYSVEVSLWIDNKKIDEVIQPMGLRYYSIDADKGFFLNGKHLALHGVCRHQERTEVGNALHKEHHDEDMKIMNEMGVNAIRLSHYPQDSYFHDLLDKNGYIAWSEIPFVGPGGYLDKGFVDSPEFRENGKQQLIELIRQNYNHPSICFWGLFNELKEDGDNPVDYIRELNLLAHKEDITRPTTAASNQGGNLNFITDLISWNRYDGWYGSTPTTLATFLDQTHEQNPELKIGISEYGAGASIYQQQDSLVQPTPNSFWHPENWQTYYHIQNWDIINERPYVWGTFVWNMFDFGAAHRHEGDHLGINDKGLVTQDRKVKKDAFYFYKANWNKDDAMVHIMEKRTSERSKAECEIMICTNQKDVVLLLNNKEIGKKRPNHLSVCTFNITLRPGENIIEAKAGKESDKCTFLLMEH